MLNTAVTNAGVDLMRFQVLERFQVSCGPWPAADSGQSRHDSGRTRLKTPDYRPLRHAAARRLHTRGL